MQPPSSDAEIVAELLEAECVSDDDDYYYLGEVADEPVNALIKMSCWKLSRLCRGSFGF